MGLTNSSPFLSPFQPMSSVQTSKAPTPSRIQKQSRLDSFSLKWYRVQRDISVYWQEGVGFFVPIHIAHACITWARETLTYLREQ